MPDVFLPPPRKPICDFCDSPDVAWAYPVAESNPHGGYAACEACSRWIEKDDLANLLKRVARKAFKHGEAPSYAAAAKAWRPGLEVFWGSRAGERVAVEGDPIDPTRTDTYGQMMREPGQTVRLEVERPQEGRSPDTTISQEAAEKLGNNAALWALSRIMRRWQATGVMAQKVSLEVNVRLDDEPVMGTGDPPLIPIDGERRWRAGG